MQRFDRTRNEQRCAHLLARSELLTTSDLDWARVGEVAVSDDVLRTLVYMRDVEAFTNRYLSGLVAHPNTLADPLIATFLPIWQAEEGEHGRALGRYLDTYGARRRVPIPPVQPPPPVDDSEKWLVLATRPIGHVVTAAHMTWGAANELLTMTGYRLLAHRVPDPVLSELLLRIAAQESRHYSFYRLQAEWRLQESRLARLVLRRLMRRAWTPVGVGEGFKSPEEFDHVLGFLAGSGEGAESVPKMDAVFARLPGMDDVRIYARAAA
jgi:hypothetical protein